MTRAAALEANDVAVPAAGLVSSWTGGQYSVIRILLGAWCAVRHVLLLASGDAAASEALC